RRLALRIAEHTALSHQFQRYLIAEAGWPVERNLKQLPKFELLARREQDPFAADVERFAGSFAGFQRLLERAPTDRHTTRETCVAPSVGPHGRPAAFALRSSLHRSS